MPTKADDLSLKYVLQCQHCKRERIQTIDHSMNLRVGDVYPHDPSNHDIGQCQGCKRWAMEIIKAPEPPPDPRPKGFTEVPTE